MRQLFTQLLRETKKSDSSIRDVEKDVLGNELTKLHCYTVRIYECHNKPHCYVTSKHKNSFVGGKKKKDIEKSDFLKKYFY